MTFDDLLTQIIDTLQRQGRVSYGALKRRFDLDDAYLDDLKAELIDAQRLAVDEDARVLVWTGARETPIVPVPMPAVVQAASLSPVTVAERRQLSVLFCDLVESTALASQLDPEIWREVVRAYHEVCAKIIARFEGRIAQYLGDGVMVYFGYPQAHEDDAPRAVRAGLGIIAALHQLNTRLQQEHGVCLAVRLGIHTGLVVVGDVGSGTRQEQLAIGETPNLAARLQGIAAPNTLVVSAATMPLLGGFFACQSLGTPDLKGLVQPLEVYQVLYESTARSRLEATVRIGLTPLVGREQEIGLLRERWAHVKDGFGQIVLLSGEAGIGKSRLVQVLREQVAAELEAWLTPCQCSPYHQHTALYPVIDVLERVALCFEPDEAPPQKLRKLEGFLLQYGLPLAETVPLFTTLLSLPLSADYGPLALSPELQKQRTLRALLTILLRIAAQQPLLFIMEDLHWVDPSTLEFLSLLVDQGPSARILVLLTCRPDFRPPWRGRAHLTQIILPRLPPRQAVEMIGAVTHHKTLPPEVQEQVVARTDGVPLFVEELTKMVLESGLLQEREAHYELTGPLPPLAIPTTLHDSLMARLDRLATVKVVAQLGATLGRTFAYDLLRAVATLDEATLQHGVRQLVDAELLYQRGVPPQATYLFKHALIQEAAYQSLLKSTRQQYHQRIAQVLEAQFPTIVATQPEVLAHHSTEAGLVMQAIPYWQRAGQHALERSAHLEAISHFTHGLDLLQGLPDTLQRSQQELALRLAVGTPLIATRGYTAPAVEHTYRRALELCQHLGETPQLFPVLGGLFIFYLVRGELHTAQQLSARFLQLVQHAQDPALLTEAYTGQGIVDYYLGDLAAARLHCERSLALYRLSPHRSHAVPYQDPQVACLIHMALTLWSLGYPDQAITRNNEALAIAQQLSHPYTLVWALDVAARFHQCCHDQRLTQERAEAAIAGAVEHGFPLSIAYGALLRGWAIAVQGQPEEGLAQMRQGLAASRTIGTRLSLSYWFGLLAEVCGRVGQIEEGLAFLAEAFAVVGDTGQRFYAVELYRLQGELQLKHTAPDAAQAEASFRQALETARQQQAKSLELRTAMSLARLWQHQGKGPAARQLLAPLYDWFTEGFDSADLQDARALLEALG